MKILFGLYCFVCLLIAGSRWALTHYFDEFRETAVTAVSEATGLTLEMAHAELSFHYVWPGITLQDVRVSAPGRPVSLVLPEVRARFAWSSLWHLEPRLLNLAVVNPSLTIRRLSDHQFNIGGFMLDTSSAGEVSSDDRTLTERLAQKNPITAWLLEQRQLELINGDIQYVDLRDPENTHELTARNTNIAFRKNLTDWQAAFDTTLINGDRRDTVSARAHVLKHLFLASDNPLSWRGKLYLKASDTDVARLFERAGFTGLLSSGQGAAEIWADFDHGTITAATADLNLSGVNADLSGNRSTEPLQMQALTVRAIYGLKSGDTVSHSLKLQGLDFITDKNLRLGSTDLSAETELAPGDRPVSGSLTVNRLDLGSLSSLIPQLPFSEEVRRFVTDRHPSGLIRNLQLSFKGSPSGPAAWRASCDFSELSLPTGSDGLPGFTNLSGTVRPAADHAGAVITLDSSRSVLSFPGIFRRPDIPLDRLKAEIDITTAPKIRLRFSDVYAENSEAAATGSGSWTATGGAGTLDIGGKLLRAQADKVAYYIPNVCGSGVLDWLEAGILGGHGTGGSYTVRGDLNHFPWHKHTDGSQFLIEADVKDGILDFLPSHERRKNGSWVTESAWPLLTDIDAHLRFEGMGMLITGKSARSLGLNASDVRVAIDSYNTAVLEVGGRIRGTLTDALGYLNKGRMIDSVLSGAFAQSRGKGPADMTLDLSVPLSHTKDFKFTVNALLKNNTFYYGLGLPAAEQLNGQLRVTEKGVTTPVPIRGVCPSGAPFSTEAVTKNGLLTLNIDAGVTAQELAAFLNLPGSEPIFEKLSGTVPVSTRVDIGLQRPLIQVTGTTSLRGLVSSLPEPYTKTAETAWPAAFSFELGKQSHQLEVTAEGHAAIALQLNAATFVPDTGFIGLGRAKQRSLPENGLTIAADVGDVSVDPWLPVASDILNRINARPTPKDHRSAGDLINVVEIKADNLHWSDRTFKDTDATLRKFGSNNWHLRIAGDSAAGQAEYESHPESHDKLTVKLNRLYLPESSRESVSNRLTSESKNPSLPDISLVIDDLRLGKQQVGKVELKARNGIKQPRPDWLIDSLVIRNPGAVINVSGHWDRSGTGDGHTDLTLSAQVSDSGALLTSLDMPDAVRDAPGKVQAQLSWEGAPHSPELKSLNGTFSAESSKGAFLQIEPGAGRLLSLLSMQHLLRRLTLDFSDVISKGFGFDSLSASGVIENGILTVPRVAVLGSSASVAMSGSINLPESNLDLHVAILPSINAGGPALALAFVNPVIGIGTFFTQWILKDQISKLLRMEYQVTGSFDQPVVTPVKRTQPAENNSPAE